jgi:hypothetical protein
MTRYRLRIQQFALTIRSPLHTTIIANNHPQQADRRAELFRALLDLVDVRDNRALLWVKDEDTAALSADQKHAVEKIGRSPNAACADSSRESESSLRLAWLVGVHSIEHVCCVEQFSGDLSRLGWPLVVCLVIG